jgi:steroid delta-isomerase-like uncharacterized protein
MEAGARMSAEENKAIVRRFYEEMNRGNQDVIDELVSTDYRVHDPSLPPEMCAGRDAFKQTVAMSQRAFPSHQMTLDNMLAEDDRVAAHLTFNGRHQGTLDDEEATGAEITFTGIGIYRIASGQIAEGWFNFDQLGLMRQMGTA